MANVFDDVLKNLNAKFSSMRRMSDIELKPGNVIPTGIDDIDINLLTIGGIPKGRIIEISGQESGGKSTLCYKLIANAQKSKGNVQKTGLVALFDAEQSAKDKVGQDWLKTQGVDTDKILYCNDIIAENIFTMIGDCCKAGFDLIIVDSVAALVGFQDSVIYGNAGKRSGRKTEKLLGESEAYGGARVKALSNALPELAKAASDGNTAIVFINQLRDNVGEMFGSPDKTPGGRALKFWSSVRLKVARKAFIEEGPKGKTKKLGVYVSVYVQKSKVSPPQKRTGLDTCGYIPLYFDGRKVTDDVASIFLMGKDLGVIAKEKTTFIYKDIRAIGQKAFIALLTPELLESLKADIKAKAASVRVYDSDDVDEPVENDDYDGAVDE